MIAVIVVVVLLTQGSPSHPAASTQHSSHPATPTSAPTPTSTPTPTSAPAPGGVTPLSSLLPADTIISSCQSKKNFRTAAGVAANDTCKTTSDLIAGYSAYQFTTAATYHRGLTNLDGLGFSAAGAGSHCPPAGAAAAQTGWHSPLHPDRSGQILQCFKDKHHGVPVYLWTLPADRVIYVAFAGTFPHLQYWWHRYG